MDPGLLTPDDPLLPHVKRRAAKGDLECLSWVLGSARRWAIGEFARRLDYEDHEWRCQPEQIQARVVSCRRKQAAVLVEAGGKEHVYTGMCSGEMTEMFVRMQIAPGNYISGVYDISDVFELPPVWTVNPWPHELDRADTGKPDVGINPFERHGVGKFPVQPARPCGSCWGLSDKSKCRTCGGTGMLEPLTVQEPLSPPRVGDVKAEADGSSSIWTGARWLRVVHQQDDQIAFSTVFHMEDGSRLTIGKENLPR